MNFFARLDRHSGLVHRMAGATGVDLGAAILSGSLSGETLRGAVLNCCNCAGAEACHGWLAARPAGAAQPPGYCRNAPLLTRLRH